MVLPGTDREIAAPERVVRVEDIGAGEFEAALRIIDMPTRVQILLSAYIRDTEGAS